MSTAQTTCQNSECQNTSWLSSQQSKKYNVPSGGEWFWDQKGALALRQDQSFIVAWDKEEGQGHKVYGIYKDAEDFYRNLLSTPGDMRWGYELIPKESPCILYLDVEWEGPDDSSGHVKIKWIVQKIRDHTGQMLKGSSELYVCCSSRMKPGGGFKNSYHLVCPNFVFQCNHDGAMKKLVEEVCQGDEWFFIKDGKKACFVDMTVYTQNRCVRLPLCCKKGSPIPFRRISGDAIDTEDDFQSVYDEADQDSWQPFIVTNPAIDGDVMVIESPSPVMISSKRSGEDPEEPRKNTKRQRESSAGVSVPIPLFRLEEVLQNFGDNVSKPTNVRYISDVPEPVWQIQCDQKKQQRNCLVNKSKVHGSNNCILFLKPVEFGKLQLQYHCTSTGCRCENRVLGYFQLSQPDYTWSFTANEADMSLDDITDEGACAAEEKPVSKEQGDTCKEADMSLDDITDEEACAAEEKPVSKEQGDTCKEADSSEAEIMTYEGRKCKFEKTNMKVRDPFVYLRVEKASNGTMRLTQFKHAEFRQFYIDWFYLDKNDKGVLVRKPFIDAWLRDPNKREVSSIVVDPKGVQTDVYNMWRGYLADQLDPSDYFQEMDPDKAMDFVVAPILRHLIDVITSGNLDHANWVLDWMANIVQRPWLKSQVPISLYGKQGCGKGILFDWFRRLVLGSVHTFQTANPQRDLFSRFSDGTVNKVLVQVDEAKCLHEYAEQLKNAVTSETTTWESKNGKIATVDNFCNLLFTSNNENALSVSSDERRLALFRCSSVYKGNTQYFENLHAHLVRPAVIAWFHKHLKERDLSRYPYDFQASRPITEYYKESQTTSVPLDKLYMSALINSKGRRSWGSSELYLSFKQWAEIGGHIRIKSHVSFGRDICRMNGVVRIKSHGMMKFELNLEDIQRHLMSTNEFDENSFLH